MGPPTPALGVSLGVAVAHLDDNLRLEPVSPLTIPLTVLEARKMAASRIWGIDPDAHLWKGEEWEVWECGGAGEVRYRGLAVFRFVSAHQGPPRLMPRSRPQSHVRQ